MANYYVSPIGYAAVAQWAAGHTYSVGNYVRQLAAQTFGNERVFKATAITTGVSGGSEPAWNRNDGATTTDSGVTWTCVSGREAEQLAGNWRAPCANIIAWTNQFGTNSSADDNVFFDAASTETNSGAYNNNLGAGKFISVHANGASLPPTSTDISTGYTIATTGANSIVLGLGASSIIDGIIFSAGSAANSASITIAPVSSASATTKDCKFVLANTNTASRINLNASGSALRYMRHVNPTFKFGSTSQQLVIAGENVTNIADATSLIDGSGSMPTNLFNSTDTSAAYSYAVWERVDFSSFTGTSFFGTNGSNLGGMDFIDCKNPSGDGMFLNLSGTAAGNPNTPFRMFNCDDGNSIIRYQEYRQGSTFIKSREDVSRVGSEALFAWEMFPSVNVYANTNARAGNPGGPTSPLYAYIPSTKVGSPVTVTVEFATTAVMDSSQLYMKLETLQDSSSPLGKSVSSGIADLLAAGAALTTTTSNWANNVPARQNSHAYANNSARLRDIISVASNPNRLFACVTAGTTASSEPGGYATATDGTNITDGTAHFVACNRYSISLTFTPERAGAIRAFIRWLFNSSMATALDSVFIDPYVLVV